MDWLIEIFTNIDIEGCCAIITAMGAIFVAIYSVYSRCKLIKTKTDNEGIRNEVNTNVQREKIEMIQEFRKGINQLDSRIGKVEKALLDKQEQIHQEELAQIQAKTISVNKDLENLKALKASISEEV